MLLHSIRLKPHHCVENFAGGLMWAWVESDYKCSGQGTSELGKMSTPNHITNIKRGTVVTWDQQAKGQIRCHPPTTRSATRVILYHAPTCLTNIQNRAHPYYTARCYTNSQQNM